MNNNKKPSQTLTIGDVFTYRGERAMFLHFTGTPRNTRYGLYREAWVRTPDSATVKWSLNMAGSVEFHGTGVV